MSIDEQLLDVIEAVYDAALDESRWHDALHRLAAVTDSQAATFWVLDGSEQPRLPTFYHINLDQPFIDEYLAEMVPLDPTVRYLVEHPKQAIVHDGMVITDREKHHHAYYDWHARYSDTRYRLVGQINPVVHIQAGVALHRVQRIGRYEPNDIERFALLYRHLERALAIGFRIGTLGTLQACTTEMLDRNPTAILLLDAQQQVVYSNLSAQALCAAGDGVRLTLSGPILQRRQDHDRLQRLIAQASSKKASARHMSGGAMQAPRPSGKRPYSLLVAPLSRHYAELSSLRPVVSILITDPETQTALPTERLCAVFGLTTAEARLAALLATGENLRAAATQLEIGYGTARTRLAEIFRKTDTHRQGELVKLLLTALAAA